MSSIPRGCAPRLELPRRSTNKYKDMKALGIIFIIVGVLCGLGGFMNTKESNLERLSRESAEHSRSSQQNLEALDNLNRSLGSSSSSYDSRHWDRSVSESSSRYSSYRNEREERMKWFFIAAVGFVVLGLILTVSASKKSEQRIET